MATPREQFNRSVGGAVTAGLPEFPKLPDCLKKRLTEEEKKDVERYEAEVQEFFKKQAVRGL